MRGVRLWPIVLLLLGALPAPVAASDTSDCAKARGNDAIAACSRLIKAGRGKSGARARHFINRCIAFARKNDLNRAASDCDEGIRLNPRSARAHAARCFVYTRQRRFDRALADCDEAERLDPRSATVFSTRCSLRRERRELDEAIADCNHAIQIRPKYAPAYSNRCLVWVDRGELDNALADCNTAIRLEPKFVIPLNNRCRVWILKKEPDRALADCTAAIRLQADYAFAYRNRAHAHLLKNDRNAALADFTQAIRIEPRYLLAFVDRGQLYESMGQFDRALADFRAALAINPRSTQARKRIERVEQKIAAAKTARSTTPAETRVALVIGNGTYRSAAKLANTRRDAESIAAALRRLNFATVVTDYDLPREKFLENLRAFAGLADRADWAVVFYAGHGIEVRGVNYLVPTDAKLASDRDISFEAVALEQVLLAVEGAQKLRLVILDACRDNPFLKSMRRTMASRSVGRGLARVEPEGATLVVYAAKEGQIALDGDGDNSPFVAALTKHLETPGLEINFLFRRVRDDVLRATDRRQEPFVYGSLPAEPFYFRNR